MSRRALQLYFGAFVLVLVCGAALAFRPTPILGFGPGDLADSVGGGVLGSERPCRRAEVGWICLIYDPATSGAAPYRVSDPNWLGCWTAQRRKAPGAPPAKSFSGCITILDH